MRVRSDRIPLSIGFSAVVASAAAVAMLLMVFPLVISSKLRIDFGLMYESRSTCNSVSYFIFRITLFIRKSEPK